MEATGTSLRALFTYGSDGVVAPESLDLRLFAVVAGLCVTRAWGAPAVTLGGVSPACSSQHLL